VIVARSLTISTLTYRDFSGFLHVLNQAWISACETICKRLLHQRPTEQNSIARLHAQWTEVFTITASVRSLTGDYISEETVPCLEIGINPTKSPSLYRALDYLFLIKDAERYAYLASYPQSIIVLIEREHNYLYNFEESFGEEKKIVKIETELCLDRYEWSRHAEIELIRSRQADLNKEKEELINRKKQLSTHEGKDMFEAITASITYLETSAKPIDEEHGKRQQELKVKLDSLLKVMTDQTAGKAFPAHTLAIPHV